ncbi:MAG: hypothetical protein E7571_06670 [Ruminococcaceae bacterium]|nr:hypothetical protein [Oscillospiraceae bacterium]
MAKKVDESKETLTAKDEKKAAKLDAKIEKAEKKKAELQEQIDDLKNKILDEKDEKVKKKLRKQRDNLTTQLNGIKKSKDGATIPLAPLAKKRLSACIAVVCVIALLCAYVATGVARNGVLAYFGVPQKNVTAFVMTDGEGKTHDIKVNTYNYYFALYYYNLRSQYEQYSQNGYDMGENAVDFDQKLSKQTTTDEDGNTITWAKYIHDQVEDSIKSTYMYYYEAVKDNGGKDPEITDEQKSELEKTVSDYAEQADANGRTISGYLTAIMGKGVTEEVMRREETIRYISQNYLTDYQDKLANKEYTNKEYQDYLKEHKDELQVVDIMWFEADSEDDAKKFKKELKADGSNFAALASKYTSKDNKFEKEANKDPVETTYKEISKALLQQANPAIAQAEEEEHEEGEEHEHSYPGLDWIFSSKRKKGDIRQQSTSVVYILKKAYMSETKTVNVRHILISPLSEEEQADGNTDATQATTKQWKAAEKKAKKILAEYKKGDKTAEAFGKLAEENSTDGSASNGGLIENVIPCQMVPAFNEWCFDSSRKTGDTAIVKTEFGYHIMYFESEGDLLVWQYSAQQALASTATTEKQTSVESAYTIKETWLGSRFLEIDTDIDS